MSIFRMVYHLTKSAYLARLRLVNCLVSIYRLVDGGETSVGAANLVGKTPYTV